MNLLRKTYYLTEVTKIHRGNSHGSPVNAKPFFLLSIIESIENGVLLNNKVCFNDNTIRDLYYDICLQYEPNRMPSPYIFPYFHLISESFYHINWSGVPFVPSPNAHSPSGKYIKENSKYIFKNLMISLDQNTGQSISNNSIEEQSAMLFFNCKNNIKVEICDINNIQNLPKFSNVIYKILSSHIAIVMTV